MASPQLTAWSGSSGKNGAAIMIKQRHCYYEGLVEVVFASFFLLVEVEAWKTADIESNNEVK